MISANAYRELAQPECAELLAALQGIKDEPTLSTLQRLRAKWSPQAVAAAVELQWARTRAAEKFGARAATLWCDREGVQMASTPAAAAWKARRFAQAGGAIVDLCCGIGGDLMELARVGDARGIDANEARAWMAQQNAGVPVECGDALGALVDGALVHADPARREGARRVFATDELIPPVADVRAACTKARGLALKLGPGLDLAAHEYDARDEIEFLYEHDTLTQQILWSGALASGPGMRTATHLDLGITLTGHAAPTPCSDTGKFHAMIAVPNPAIERAQLMRMVAGNAQEPAAGLGVLTADEIAPSPWLDVHRVVAELQARERTVAEWLRAHGGGVPTVHTRGKACDPNAWQKELRSPGEAKHHVWVLRVGDRRTALITEPAAAPQWP